MTVDAIKSAVCALVSLPEYREPRQRVFPSEGSLRWFVRTHSAELADAGALLLIGGRHHVDPDLFDRVVREVGERAAQRQVALSLGTV